MNHAGDEPGVNYGSAIAPAGRLMNLGSDTPSRLMNLASDTAASQRLMNPRALSAKACSLQEQLKRLLWKNG